MKVGTDALLLGSLADPSGAKSILDIGTGTGVLALMMAQKSNAPTIDAIEIDEAAASQASENFKASRWSPRLNIYHSALQDFTDAKAEKYDLIISNPPYFESPRESKGITLDNESSRGKARNFSSLSFDELLACTVKLLKPEGAFEVIIPTQAREQFIQIATYYGLNTVKEVSVHSLPDKPDVRTILRFEFQKPASIITTSLIIYQSHRQYSEAYIALTKGFHAHNLSKK